jgi:hypothetical protein
MYLILRLPNEFSTAVTAIVLRVSQIVAESHVSLCKVVNHVLTTAMLCFQLKIKRW